MIEYKTRPKIHKSHKMTEWQSDVLRFLGKPKIFSARRCEVCEAIQAERYDIKYLNSALVRGCGKKEWYLG